ncbi:competence protein ComEC [Klebsiella aerogenes]|uniref:ComEC family protein n=1 Tax=Klebsiella aerogenes TaxID=548 RepID=UPI00063C66D0|nr:ComEC family protein [Klebsiella aerogenes]KLF17265.1 competence protein ComEC [Klebsiella aerogenes]
MRLPHLAGCAIIGISPLLWLPALPNMLSVWCLIGVAIIMATLRKPYTTYAALTLLFFVWGILHARQALWPTEHIPGRNRQAVIELVGGDGLTSWQGKIIRLEGRRLYPAVGITLYGGELPAAGCVGQRWLMTIRARPVHGQLNEGGFDSQRYALAQHRPLSGRFLNASSLDSRCSSRARYLDSLNRSLADYPWRTVMLGLGMGERLAVADEIKRLMQDTGTSHLMAISGLHIALGASLGWLLVRGIQFFLPCRWIGWRIPLLVGLGCALFYAWLTGMQPPALRTCAALTAGCLLRLQARRWSPWQIFCCCIAAILLADPLAIISESLWLSVFAVAALIFWYQLAPLRPYRCHSPWRHLLALSHLQCGLMLLLAPLQIALFHGISLTSLIANLIAVPLVTFLIVPLILAAMLLHLSGPALLEMALWQLADRLLAILFWFLRHLPAGWVSLDERWLAVSLLPWLALLVWRFQAWRQMPLLCISGVALLSWPFWRAASPGEWRVTMLDVGQGLAVVIERQGAAILYDTGPAWPGGDSGERLIVPWLRWRGLHPEGIILSHEHLDHRGGLNAIIQAWPNLVIRSPLKARGHLPCRRGETWRWRGLRFQALWPLPAGEHKGNNGSCVVRVDDGKRSVLLTGDIEIPAEEQMISHYWQHLMSTLIQVPHHGSNTSSGVTLLQRVGGEAAIASAARYNAWKMPSQKVAQRYREQGYRWFDTPHSGQITIIFSPEGWQIHSLRDQLLPRWYHQWFGGDAQNG